MATTRIPLDITSAQPVPGVTLPELKQAGSSIYVYSYSFDASAEEGIQFSIPYAPTYGSGNITVKLHWYADTATTNSVTWGCAVAAITPNSDTQNAETDTWQTEATNFTSASGSAQAIVTTSVTVTSIDSLATADLLFLRIKRIVGDANDTMAGDAQLVAVVVEYSDT